MTRLPMTLVLGSCLMASSAMAAEDGCVRLSGQHNTARFGTQYLLVKDADQHYKVSFSGNQCGMIALTSKLKFKTGDELNTLCSSGSTVSSRSGTCRVSAVESIDADKFAALKRRR